MIHLRYREYSLDDFADAERRTRWSDLLTDGRCRDQERAVYLREVGRLMREAILDLDSRQRRIIEDRFGFGGGEEQTLQQIGDSLRLSRERVRQLEREATRRLGKRLRDGRGHARYASV